MANRITDNGSGSGTFFSMPEDDWHRVIDNSSVGWANLFPEPGNGVYQWS
jgi:hypothetical protein